MTNSQSFEFRSLAVRYKFNPRGKPSRDQCLKCLRPVKIIAMPCSLAPAITSSSLIEPPG